MNRNFLLLAPLVCFLFIVVTITGCAIENVEQSTTSLSAFEERLEEPMPDTAEPEPILNASEQKFPGSASESANIQSNPTESKAEAFPAFDWDAVAQWREPAVEALVREKLGKVSGDIMQSDLDHIWAVELFGDTHIYFNADGGYVMWKSIEGYSYLEESWNPSNIDIGFNDAEGNEYKSGIYSVNEEQFKRGSVLSLKDFGNFRNLRFLHVYKNSLQDLDGLSDLENLIELKLTDNDIFDITALSLLTQIDSLRIYGGLIEDITPLSNLTRLTKLFLTENHISDLSALSSLHNLKYLVLKSNLITNLNVIDSFPDLMNLNLSANPISSLEMIKGLEHLRYLYFSKTSIDDLSPLSGKTSIIGLTMEDLKVNSIDLMPLSTLKSLKSLSIHQDQAEMINFQVLGTLKKLFYLNILNSIGVTDEEFDWLKQELPGCPLT